MTTQQDEVNSVAAQLGLTMKVVFVPFSQSRSKGEKSPSLNWLVTLAKGGREFLTTDYMAGCGHCPSHQQRATVDTDKAVRFECENGKSARNALPILPDLADVLYSLVSDADVIDAGGFEDWASNYGYDTDSRKAEATYRDCLEAALKLRGAIGDEGLRQLREALQDY